MAYVKFCQLIKGCHIYYYMSTSAQRRLLKDLKRIQNEAGDEIIASPQNNNLLRWSATIEGIEETPWQGGLFQLKLEFSENYPNKPPMVKFISEMFHPNIYNDGRICLDMLQNQWSPIYDVWSILTAIRTLLADPNTLSPANMVASNIFRDNKILYQQKVREIVEKSLDNAIDEDEMFKEEPQEQPQEERQNQMEVNRIAVNSVGLTGNMMNQGNWAQYSFASLPTFQPQIREQQGMSVNNMGNLQPERIIFQLPFPNAMVARRAQPHPHPHAHHQPHPQPQPQPQPQQQQQEEDEDNFSDDSSELDEAEVIVADGDDSLVQYEEMDSDGDGDEQDVEDDDENAADPNNLNENDDSS